MTNPEMLELAAKAAGYSVQGIHLYSQGCLLSDGTHWNPRGSTADSAGLAIRLMMTVSVGDTAVRAEREIDGVLHEYTAMLKDHGGCPGAAYRHAAFHVAAQIGALMP